MSTNDVPGSKPSNHDTLAVGCWAEHGDGSLILVEGTEDSQVIYSIFDVEQDPPVEYRDAMPEDGFKKQFSWPSKSDIKWTWHDKTPFPWDRVMKDFKSGNKLSSVSGVISVARRIGESLNLRAQSFRSSEKRSAEEVLQRIKDAILELE